MIKRNRLGKIFEFMNLPYTLLGKETEVANLCPTQIKL
jgi:hypothetical protein